MSDSEQRYRQALTDLVSFAIGLDESRLVKMAELPDIPAMLGEVGEQMLEPHIHDDTKPTITNVSFSCLICRTLHHAVEQNRAEYPS